MLPTDSEPEPLVVLVVAVFNRRRATQAFLRRIKTQTYPNFLTVVVDDGSTDGTAEMVGRDHPEAVVLTAPGDLWWSGATNLGVRYAVDHGADFVVTINDDVDLDDDYLAHLVAASRAHPSSLIGSKVCDVRDRDRVLFFGTTFAPKGDLSHVTGRDALFTSDAPSESLIGKGLLVPAAVFARVGLYDAARFPHYFGDTEFSLRARRAGYPLWVSARAKVYDERGTPWLVQQLRDPQLGFLSELLTSRRSPFQWDARRRFYRDHWPGNHRRALLRFYCLRLAGVYQAYAFALLRKLAGRIRG